MVWLRKNWFLAAICAHLLFVPAGCGSSDDDAGATSRLTVQNSTESPGYPKPDPEVFRSLAVSSTDGSPASGTSVGFGHRYSRNWRPIRRFVPRASDGNGGAFGHYEAETAGVEFKVWTPSQEELERGPTQVFMYLHGDTARDYHDDFAFASVRDYVLSKGLIFTAVLAPDEDSWWRSDADKVTRGISGVFEYLFDNYDVYENANFIQGVSGGSTGQTMYFYPMGGAKYVRASFLDCGGAAGGYLQSWAPSDETVRNTRFFITHGEDDYLADPDGTYGDVIGDVKEYLNGEDFFVKTRVLEDEGHCTFSHLPHVREELPALLVDDGDPEL